jgi:hypothetical protein
MNSSIPKWMVLPGALVEPSERLEEKHAANPPTWHANYRCFLHRQDRVVKIMCSCSAVVLQIMKNYEAHYSLSWFSPLLRGNSPTSSVFVLEKTNSVTKGVS